MRETGYFGEIAISKKTMAAITAMGFEEPSPIQSQTIPLVLAGRDVIGQAQTGTGKTAAFGIPITERLGDAHQVQALVLSPTRELAIQVAEELSKIGRFRHSKVVPIYGGQPIERQIRALKLGAQVVIGTPGRLLDHIRRGTINLQHVQTLVLDEADEMLDMGFIEDIETIIKQLPAERQTLLFSATMPESIRRLADNYLHEPVFVSISKEQLTVPLIEQVYYETRDKLDGLCRVLDTTEIERAIIFCRTKKGVDELTASLQTRGYIAGGLHGDLNQAQRDRVMHKFRDGNIDLLVATDVAARGLDIENVSHVINFDIPQDPESYVHRIGRTGRAGHSGMALTFIEPREYRQLRLIEKIAKTRIRRASLPSPADVIERQREALQDRLVQVLNQGGLGEYRAIAAALSSEHDPLDIAAAAIKFSFAGQKSQPAAVAYGDTGAEPGMVRLFINIGRIHKVRPEDFVKTIAEETGIAGNSIGAISILDKFSFVEVPEEAAEKVIGIMNRNYLKGRRINVEPAKGRNS